MGNLLNFIIKHGAWIVFILLQVLCMIFIYKDNPYQRSIMMSSCNQVTGAVYEVSNNISGYFYLRTENQALLRKNAELEKELFQLKSVLDKSDTNRELLSTSDYEEVEKYKEIFAQVINNSVARMDNYLVLDKGARDGVCEGMGVVNQNGVVGIVCKVSGRYSAVISLLNSKSRISCKVKGDDAIGSLIWKGEDPTFARLIELPRYSEYEMGDTIITSGYSAVFPEGLMVGTIVQTDKEKKDFNTVQIKLSADFYRLNNVRVIGNVYKEEQKELEKEAGLSD